MNRKLQEKLLALDAEKYAIKLHVGPYLDGFASIYEQEDGSIVFDSEVYSEFNLDEVSESDVDVYQLIENWQDIED